MADPLAPAHQPWVDNLRVAIIVGVIGAHVSLIYALDVGWYYEERTASTAAQAILAAVFAPGLLFGMGLLFFVAGLFTPSALTRKGPLRFAADRLRRLGIPVVAYLFVINPAMNLLGDRAAGQREGSADYFRRTYRDDVELGVSWFVAALLLFSLAWAAWRSRYPASSEDRTPLRRRVLLEAGGCIAAASFVLRLRWPFLSTDELGGLNLWEYPQMLTLFVLGALARERQWLDDGLPGEVRRFCGRAALIGVIAAVILAVALTVTDDPDPFLGGLRLEALLIPMIEATIAVGTSVWVTGWFRTRWNRAGATAEHAGRASFAAYLGHAPITVLLAVALRSVGVPGEVKFVVVFAASVVIAFGAGWLVTRSKAAGPVL